MYPEDRVLVGGMKAKRDLKFAQNDGWYRIPQLQMPRGVNADYVAFFLGSSSVFKGQRSTIAYYAQVRGFELARRRDLVPSQPNHKRADEIYYKVKLGEVLEKIPPITNPTNRRFAFIRTTWDRFLKAQEIKDLYSTADYFVDRIYHALQSPGMQLERFWEVDQERTGYPPQIRILCQKGTVIASTERMNGAIFLDQNQDEDAILRQIREDIERHDGLVLMSVSPDR